MKVLQSLVAAGIALAVGRGPAMAEELKFASFLPASSPYQAGAFEPFAQGLAAATEGKITVRIYPSGELGAGAVEQYARAVDGVADFAVSLPGYTASSFPLTLLAELPGVLTEAEGTARLWQNIGLFAPEYRRVQLVSLWLNAQNVLYTRDRAVRSPADAAGMKIRVPSRNTGLVVESWGATPVSLPAPEIYNALQTGVIDGVLVDGTATTAFRLGEVAKYLTVGMETTLSPLFIVMNRDSYRALGAGQQEAVRTVGREVSLAASRSQAAAAEAGIEAFAALPGKSVIRLDTAQAAAFNVLSRRVTARVVEEADRKGLPARKVVDALRAD